MELIKARRQFWDGRIYHLNGFGGICKCGTPVETRHPIEAIRLAEDNRRILFWTLTVYLCPACREPIGPTLTVYKSLEITQELKGIINAPHDTT